MDEFLKKLRELLGSDDSLTADNALSRIGDHIKGLTTKNTDLQKQLGDIQGQLDKLKSDTKAASINVDPNLAEQMGVTADQQLDLLVQTGKITPAVKDKLAASLIGVPGSRNIMALSIGTGGTPSVFSKVVEALKDNDPVKLGEVTKVQTLSRQVPGEHKPEEPDQEVGLALSRGAGIPEKK